MLARLQRLIIFAGSGCFIALEAILFVYGHASIGSAFGLVILLSYPMVIAVELMLSAKVSKSVDPPVNLPRAGDLSRAWWGEVLLAPKVFLWRQPFHPWSEPDSLPSTALGHRGVVLVHGLVCNRAFWNPWMRRLRQTQTVFVAVNLEPLFDSIDQYRSIIDEAVARVTATTGMAPVLVGHSMGGLAIRHWLMAPADDAAHSRVHHVITIGTPHRGTWLARFTSTTNTREMAIGSSWLGRLEMRPGAAEAAHLFTCFYGNCDNVVFPSSCATLQGADNRLLGATAHMKLAFRDEVFEELQRRLVETDKLSIG